MRIVTLVLLVAFLVGASSFRAIPADEDPGAQALQERLRQTMVNLAVEQQELGNVLDILRVQTGLNLLIDPRIESDVLEIPVTGLFVENLPLSTVLDMLRDAAGEECVWTPRGNVLILTRREFVRDAQTVRIYPVAALTTGRTSFVPSVSGLVGAEHDPHEHVPDRYQPFGSADELIDLMRGAVSPRYWEETEGADIRTVGEHRLVVKAAPRIHAAIDRFFAGLVGMSPDAIQVEIRAVAPSEKPFDAVAKDAATADETAAALLASPDAGPALCLAVRPGLPSTTFTGTRRAFVAGYDAHFAGSVSTLDPRVESLDVGMAASVRALPDPAGRHILLKLDVALAEPTEEPTRPSDAGAGVARVRRHVVRREGVLLVTPGRWHLMEGRTGGEDAVRWGFLVRATPVRSERPVAPTPAAFEVPAPRRPGDAPAFANRRIKDIAWEELSLDEVLTYLRTITGLNFYVTPRLREDVFEDVVISLRLADASLATVLDLITEPYELTWRTKDGLVALDVRRHESEQMALRYFDAKDLVEGINPAQIDASPDVPSDPDEANPAPMYPAENLVELVRESIGGEEAWEDPAAIEARNGILIARNTPPILDAIDRFMDGLRASRVMVVTTVDQVEMDDASARSLLGSPEEGGCPLLLNERARAALAAAVEAGRVTHLSQERVVSLQGSGSPRATGAEIPYVADYEIHTSGTGDASAPVTQVETLHSGTRVHVRSLPIYPGSQIYLEVDLERAVLKGMRKADTPHGQIDLPVQEVWSVRTGLRVSDGQTAIVSASRTNGRWRLLLVSPRRGLRGEYE